jgi:succinate-semialdehyde dehydrogenase/glutarate-semialdehyde dehydrogenase
MHESGTTERTPRESISVNPATGEELGRTPELGPEDCMAAMRLARAAQPAWAATSLRTRQERMRRIRDHIAAHADELAEIISRENGKTRMDALSTEVVPAAMATSYYARRARTVLRRHRMPVGNLLFANKRSYCDRVPFGVVGIISPWNYPFGIPMHEVIMALVCGNAVILKVATPCQLTGAAIARCVDAADLPPGIFQILNIPGAIAGDAFIEAGVDKLFFTGSVPVGKKLMAAASRKLIPISLELGGNDPMIVCADADLERAAAGAAWAGFSNAGQSCGAVERIYVERSVYNEFMALLRSITSRLRTGPDTDFNVDVGAVTTRKQLQTITDHVADALAKGAEATASGTFVGNTGNGNFFAPTVLENVTGDMITMQDETFGPILAVSAFDTPDEAIGMANNSPLGLTASIWTRNRKEAHRLAAHLHAGAVTINDHLMSHGLAETPWGGFKQSGIGRTHGDEGLLEMTQPRVVVADILPGVKRNMWWYPHSRKVYNGLLGALHVLYGGGPRLLGAIRLAGVFLRTFTTERRD